MNRTRYTLALQRKVAANLYRRHLACPQRQEMQAGSLRYKRPCAVGLGVLILALVAMSGWAGAEIEGSKHDFSHEDWSEGDTCSVCHTPHRQVPPKAAPLWNPNADLDRTFGSSTGKRPQKAQPGSGTLACLRCHDGTVAPDVASGVGSGRQGNKQHDGLFTAGHTTSDHPIGVPYPGFDKGFQPEATVVAKGIPLPDGKVECISCHDPHNQANADPMLNRSNERSALCLTCHKK